MEENFQTNDCLNCEYDKICCSQYSVALNKEEVLSGFFEGNTKIVPLTESRKILGYVMVLKKKDDGFCIFNDENRLCSIYENRPLACKKFICVGKSWHK